MCWLFLQSALAMQVQWHSLRVYREEYSHLKVSEQCRLSCPVQPDVKSTA